MSLFALAASVPPAHRTGWDDIQAIGPTVAAALVLIGALITVVQKARSDGRTHWWARVQWAADKVASEDDIDQAIGMAALAALVTGGETNSADRALLRELANALLTPLAVEVDDDDVEFVVDGGA